VLLTLGPSILLPEQIATTAGLLLAIAGSIGLVQAWLRA